MQIIQQITSDPYQQQRVTLLDGTSFIITIRFVPMQYGWFITSLSYGTMFTLQGFRITNSPNMLHQFRNQIPFGIACVSSGNREPSQKEDFSSEASILYLLTSAEVNQYAEYLSGQVIS